MTDNLVCKLYPEAGDGGMVAVDGRLLWSDKLLVPGDYDHDGKFKYSTSLLLPKVLDLSPLIKFEADAAANEHGKDWQRLCDSNRCRALYKTADSKYEWLRELSDEYPMYLKASQSDKVKPLIWAAQKQEYKGDGSDIQDGRWARVLVDVFAYDNKQKGVKFGPKEVFLRKMDARIGGKRVSVGFDDITDIPERPQDADGVWAA